MHGISGPRTNFNSLKCYVNHTTAFEGQFRMPRNYAPQKVDVRIKNYNYCNCGSVNTGFQLPSWLQWAQFGLNFLSNLFPAQQAPKQDVNPLQEQMDKLNEEINKLKKENEELRNKKPAEEAPAANTPAAVTPAEDPDNNNDAAEIQFNSIEVGGSDEIPEKVLTTEVGVPKAKKKANGDVDYYGWNTLTNAYGVPNTREFRDWFRQKYLGGSDIWKSGTQNFPTEINYPEGSENKYEFNKGKFLEKPLDSHHPTSTGSGVKEGGTQKIVQKGQAAQAGATTHGGSFTGTVDGKKYSVRTDGQADQNAVRKDLEKQLVNKGLSADAAAKAVQNAKVK